MTPTPDMPEKCDFKKWLKEKAQLNQELRDEDGWLTVAEARRLRQLKQLIKDHKKVACIYCQPTPPEIPDSSKNEDGYQEKCKCGHERFSHYRGDCSFALRGVCCLCKEFTTCHTSPEKQIKDKLYNMALNNAAEALQPPLASCPCHDHCTLKNHGKCVKDDCIGSQDCCCGKPKSNSSETPPSSSDKGILNNSGKKILDVCCGGRMFWFNKNHPDALYVDRRVVDLVMVGKDKNARMFSCQPDEVMDFRDLKIKSNSYSLVVFDPPHLTSLGAKSYMAQKYGTLDKTTWQWDLAKGFSECFRVLKANGILIFKWNETDIPLSKILALTPVQPLFGHPSGKTARTHWITFMKI